MINKSKVVAVVDIETTTLEDGSSFAYAFTVLQTDEIEDRSRETIKIMRQEKEFVNWLHSLGVDGWLAGYTPVVASYNLAFDFAGFAHEIRKQYYTHELRSSSGLLAVDIYTHAANIGEEQPFIRLWNVQPFVPRGLEYMGKLAGIDKLAGSLDYTLTRSRATPLTPEEVEYCKRDVKIIAEFLRFLLASFEWLRAGDLGRVCLTPASVIRLYQNRRVGVLRGGSRNLMQEWHALTHRDRENANDEQRLLRREAYAGGFTFTTAASYFQNVENVQIYDMDSAYHFALFNNPTVTDFHMVDPEALPALKKIIEERLSEPLNLAAPLGRLRGHFRVTFKNVRPRPTAWSAAARVGYLSARRAQRKARIVLNSTGEDTAKISASGLIESFGRIIAAESLTMTCDEYELRGLSLSYIWESMSVEAAEVATRKTERASFVRLSSLILREMKKEKKQRGGTEYELFKTIYNAQAGVYAELEREGFTLSYLPTAIRQTSFTRLALWLAAQCVTAEGARVISGDTDSLRVAGAAEDIARGLAYHANILKTLIVEPSDLEEDMSGIDLKASLAGLGEFKHETSALLLREMGSKARAWIEEDSTGREVFKIKHAGLKTQRLEELANNGVRTPREWLEDLQPFTWIEPAVAKHVKRQKAEEEQREYQGVDYVGEPFKLTASPCITLKDEVVCIALPLGATAKRLKEAGIYDNLREGWLSEQGREQIL